MSDSKEEALARFASIVRRCRAGAGYPDARAFYKAFGGAAFFGCTYKAFAGLENGLGLAQPRLIERLVAALRLPLRKRLAREFALAYLRLFLGSEEFLDLAVAALSEEKPEACVKPPREEFRLNRRQSDFLSRDADSRWCFSVLTNDAGRWDPDSLASLLELPGAAVRKALGRLKAAGLASRDASGRYGSALAGKRIIHPGDQDPKFAGGATLMEHPLLLRASEAELRQYFPLLVEGLRGAEDYATLAKGPDTALFQIEARVSKLVSF